MVARRPPKAWRSNVAAQYLDQERLGDMEMHEGAPIRVLVVGDHVLLRQGIRVLLNEEQDFEVVGEADNEKVAVSLTTEPKPNIVLVDIGLATYGALAVPKHFLPTSP